MSYSSQKGFIRCCLDPDTMIQIPEIKQSIGMLLQSWFVTTACRDLIQFSVRGLRLVLEACHLVLEKNTRPQSQVRIMLQTSWEVLRPFWVACPTPSFCTFLGGILIPNLGFFKLILELEGLLQ